MGEKLPDNHRIVRDRGDKQKDYVFKMGETVANNKSDVLLEDIEKQYKVTNDATEHFDD